MLRLAYFAGRRLGLQTLSWLPASEASGVPFVS
jgi:hypothetical protein